MGLDDAVLIKENHVALAGGLAEAVRRARAAEPEREVEVECRTPTRSQEALEAGADRLLLDNMDAVRELRAAVAARDAAASRTAASRPSRPRAGSRSRTRRRSPPPASTSISVGALTHSAPALDLSMLLERADR